MGEKGRVRDKKSTETGRKKRDTQGKRRICKETSVGERKGDEILEGRLRKRGEETMMEETESKVQPVMKEKINAQSNMKRQSGKEERKKGQERKGEREERRKQK